MIELQKIYGVGALLLSLQYFLIDTSYAGGSEDFTCDCSKKVSSCNAAIMVKPTGDRKGTFGADLILKSDAEYCSKIDYYVDSTPYFTIIKKGYSGEDRILGTSATKLDRSNISDISCKVCKKITSKKEAHDAEGYQPANNDGSRFDGLWVGEVSARGYSRGYKLEVHTNESKANLKVEHPGTFFGTSTYQTDDGVINGNKLSFSWKLDMGSGRNYCTLTLLSESSADYACPEFGATGVMRKQ